MDKLALIISLVSLILSYIAYTSKNKCEKIIDKSSKKLSAILFKSKKPEQIRFEHTLQKNKNNKDIKLDDIC